MSGARWAASNLVRSVMELDEWSSTGIAEEATEATRQPSAARDPPKVVRHYFNLFREAYETQNHGIASDLFIAALAVHPGIAFRHFISRASGAVAASLYRTGKMAETANALDRLIGRYPDIHVLCDEPEQVGRQVRLREDNIAKGLPSIVMVTQGKAASAAVSQIFHSGFELPSFAYSLVNHEVIESWAADFALGGACYTTHLYPYPDNIARLKRSGVKKIIVHLRDPRQSLLSLVHHFIRYPEQHPELIKRGFDQQPIAEQLDTLIESYISRIRFIEGWVQAEEELDIMFSTFEEFVCDRDAFIQRYLGFYGGPLEHFSYDKATHRHAGIDYRYRAGRTDEWREVFPAHYANCLSQFLPEGLKLRFGWAE